MLERKSEPARMSRRTRVWLAIGLVGSYSIVTVAAGHGIVPAGLLLVFGLVWTPNPVWFPAGIAGWGGVALALVSCRKNSRTHELVLAVATLTVSAGLFASKSEVLAFTLLTAVPFGGVVIIVLRLLFGPMSHAAERGASPYGGSGDIPP
jgi:hypothetical protein